LDDSLGWGTSLATKTFPAQPSKYYSTPSLCSKTFYKEETNILGGGGKKKKEKTE
jgi:hypothetical protein